MELIYALPLEICLYIEKIKSKIELHDKLQRAKRHLETNFIRYPLPRHDQPLFYLFFAVTLGPNFIPTDDYYFFPDDYEFFRFKTKSGLRISRSYFFYTIIKTSVFKGCVITDYKFRFYNHKHEVIKHYKKKVWKAFYDFQIFYTLYLNVYVTYSLCKRYFE